MSGAEPQEEFVNVEEKTQEEALRITGPLCRLAHLKASLCSRAQRLLQRWTARRHTCRTTIWARLGKDSVIQISLLPSSFLRQHASLASHLLLRQSSTCWQNQYSESDRCDRKQKRHSGLFQGIVTSKDWNGSTQEPVSAPPLLHTPSPLCAHCHMGINMHLQKRIFTTSPKPN